MIGKRTFKLISLKLSLNNYSKFVIYMNNTDTGIDIISKRTHEIASETVKRQTRNS